VVSQHRRYELLDVSLAGVPIGRCTIDEWQDERGDRQWAARVLMARDHEATSGQLIGRTREGAFLTGPAMVAAGQEGPRGARTVLLELHGTGPLVPTTDPAAATQQ
jgi:hypothetical protein